MDKTADAPRNKRKKTKPPPPINFITINVRRELGDTITDAQRDEEDKYVLKIVDLFDIEDDVVIRVHDCCGVYLYSPKGED